MPKYQLVACVICDGLGYTLKYGRFAEAQLCQCYNPCPECLGVGYKIHQDDQGRDIAKPCSCSTLRRGIHCFNQAQIPEKYSDANLNNFENTNQPKLKKAIQIAQQLLKKPAPAKKVGKTQAEKTTTAPNKLRLGHGILCYGNPGSGKTRLLAAMLKSYAFEHQLTCRYVEFSHLLNQIRTAYNNHVDDATVLQPLVNIDVLALDELGKGRNREWEHTIIDNLVSNRYNQKKITLFATNYPLTKAYKKTETPAETLEDRVLARIYSRLKEMCVFVDMNLKDFRAEDVAVNSLIDEQKSSKKTSEEDSEVTI